MQRLAVPRPAPAARAVFLKKGRVAMDLSLASVAVLLELDGGRCRRARVAAGSVAPRPLRLRGVEALLEGQTVAPAFAPDTIAAARAQAEREVSPISDVRAGAGYRRHVVGALLARAVGRLTGGREGCGNGECGACTVLVDGKAVNACLMPALEAEGRTITTIEGLVGPGGKLAPLQSAFVEHGGIQCGFCTPGMILAAKALLDANPAPTEGEIRTALVGNLCRCTGYTQIVQAVQAAAAAGADRPWGDHA